MYVASVYATYTHSYQTGLYMNIIAHSEESDIDHSLCADGNHRYPYVFVCAGMPKLLNASESEEIIPGAIIPSMASVSSAQRVHTAHRAHRCSFMPDREDAYLRLGTVTVFVRDQDRSLRF